jgi:hypothetical protein
VSFEERREGRNMKRTKKREETNRRNRGAWSSFFYFIF